MNEVTTITPQEKVTEKLLMDYLKQSTKGLTEIQMAQFCAVAQAFNLNPLKREVYAVTYKDKEGKTTLSIVTGYEVYLKRAEASGMFDGYETEFKGGFKKKLKTVEGKFGPYDKMELEAEPNTSCTCIVWRKDLSHPIKSTVYFDEYNQNNNMWLTKPRVMLEKVAIVSAFRKAFPNDFNGMPYTSDELPDKMTPQKIECQEVASEPPKPQKTFISMVLDECEKAQDRSVLETLLKKYNAKELDDITQEQKRPFFIELKDGLAQLNKIKSQINNLGTNEPANETETTEPEFELQ